MAAVMMGDIGAVSVVQEAHTRMMLQKRVLRPRELVGGSPEFMWHEAFGDVYIDDLVLLVLGSVSSPPKELRERLDLADLGYKEEGLAVKADKGQDGSIDASFWGASLRGVEGKLGFSMARRSSLAAITLFGL
eukprot:6077501-Amphidinium_carterae.1